ncbi:MAG: hypothetical protein ACM3ZU_08200 [Bacteroidota bacterium]
MLFKRKRRQVPADAWETCGICGYASRSRDVREIELEGRRVKACPSCRAKLIQERLRREREKEITGQLMW